MARSIDDSLNLLSSSLTNINNSLVSKGVASTSGLKLSQVASKIRQVQLKPKTGTLRIGQNVNYASAVTYKDDSFITFTHSLRSSDGSYNQNITLVGTCVYELVLPVGTYILTRQTDNTSSGVGNYSTNFTSNEVTIVITEGQTNTTSFTYTRITQNVTFTFAISGSVANKTLYTTDNYAYVESNEIKRTRINSSPMRIGPNYFGTAYTAGSMSVPIGKGYFGGNSSTVYSVSGTTLTTIYYYVVEYTSFNPTTITSSTTTCRIGTTWKSSSSSPTNPEEPSFEGMSLKDKQEIPVTFEVLDDVQMDSISETNEITSIEYDEELGCHIINGLPYYGDPENYPDPYRKVYAEDYTGEIIKENLTPISKNEIEILELESNYEEI